MRHVYSLRMLVQSKVATVLFVNSILLDFERSSRGVRAVENFILVKRSVIHLEISETLDLCITLGSERLFMITFTWCGRISLLYSLLIVCTICSEETPDWTLERTECFVAPLKTLRKNFAFLVVLSCICLAQKLQFRMVSSIDWHILPMKHLFL